MKAATKKAVETVELKPLDIRSIQMTLVGDSSLIVHKWSEKAKKQMLDTQMKKAKSAKAAKDPEQDYRDSLYEHPEGGYGFPSIGLKAAAVAAAVQADLFKTEARAAFHIDGDLVKIQGEPTIREDMVRVGMGGADLRYRGEFKDWKIVFTLKYNASVLSSEQIVNLFNLAGFGVGVGEWRPQKNGSFGRFHVE